MEQNGEASIIIAIATVVIIGLFFIFLLFLFIRRKNKLLQAQKDAEQQFEQEIATTQTEIQKETMNYIGREIHDNVGQKLTLSSLYLQRLVLENKASQVNESLNNINDIINGSLTALRQLSKSLTDDTIQENSITELIENECAKIRQLKKCDINFKSSLNRIVNSYQIKSILLRITQEFIQNSLKHSNCKKININLSDTDNQIIVLLKDDGIGFNSHIESTNGIGLNNIKKRIEMLGGEHKILSDKKGTQLTLKIPI